MNAELYSEYCAYVSKAVPKIAYSYKVPEYLLEEYCMDAFPAFEKNFDLSKACLKTYAIRIFKNIAIDMAKKAPVEEFNEAEYAAYISQEHQVILSDAIQCLSDASKWIVDSVLTGQAPIKKVKRHGGMEKTHIKKWLITKGWTMKKINKCFSEIGQMLKEVAV